MEHTNQPSEPDKNDLKLRLTEQIKARRELGVAAPEPSMAYAAWDVAFDRFVAFLFDCLILASFGKLIVFIAGNSLFPLGEDVWWIGLVIGAAYFSVFDSYLFKGQTLGKKLMEIETRKIDGAYLNPFDALIRAFPFIIIYAIYFSMRYESDVSCVAMGFEIFAAILAIAVVVFGLAHPERRSIHDVLLDTGVVRAGDTGQFNDVSLATPLAIFAALAVIVTGGWIYLYKCNTDSPENNFVRMFDTRSDIKDAAASLSLATDDTNNIIPSLVFSAYTPEFAKLADDRMAGFVARQIASVITGSGKLPDEVRQIVVYLRSGYDIGLARKMETSLTKIPIFKTKPSKVIYKFTPGRSQDLKSKTPPPAPAPAK